MSTPHIESETYEIAPIVLMPGDPLRAKYIAENFLEDYRLVNDVRNMYFYTGTYKGTKVTIASSGMGIPSMGIYAYELIKFYNVKTIIRIGTCGSFNENIKIQDVILSTGSFSYTYFPKLLDNVETNFVESSSKINNVIENKAKELNIDLKVGKTITSDIFDVYCEDPETFRSNYKDDSYLGVEMEAFALYYLAKKFNVDATTLMTVVDSLYDKTQISSEDREKGLNEMINLALESLIEYEV